MESRLEIFGQNYIRPILLPNFLGVETILSVMRYFTPAVYEEFGHAALPEELKRWFIRELAAFLLTASDLGISRDEALSELERREKGQGFIVPPSVLFRKYIEARRGSKETV